MLVCFLALLFPLLWWPGAHSPATLRSSLLVALAPGLVLLAADRQLARRPVFLIAGCGLLWSWLTLIWAAQPMIGVVSAATRSGAIAGCALAVSCTSHPARRRQLGWMLLCGGWLLALISLAQHFLSLPYFGQAMSATIGHRNFLAGIFVGQIGLAAALACDCSGAKQRALALVSIPLFAGLILASASRGALLGLVAGLGAALLLALLALRGGRRRWVLGGVGGLLTLLLLSLLAAPSWRARALSAFDSTNPTVALRLSTYRSTWQLGLARPLRGWGEGNFFLVFPAHREPRFSWAPEIALDFPAPHIPSLRNAHNEYLQTFAEQGLPGLALLLATLGAIGWRVVRRLREAPPSAGLLVALAAGWTGMLTHALVSPALRFPSVLVFFWLVTAVLLSHLDPAPREREAQRVRPALAVVCILLSAVFFSARPMLADLGMAAAESHPDRSSAQKRAALRRAQQAATWDPYTVNLYPLMVRLALELKDLSALEAAIRGARKSLPGYHPTDIWQARLLLARGRPAEAVGPISRGLSRAPRHGPWLLLQGQIFAAAGRAREAEAAWRAAYSYQANLSQAAFALERAAYRRRAWSTGLRWLIAGLRAGVRAEKIPSSARLRAQRAKGMRALASESKQPSSRLLLELGTVAYRRGQLETARGFWQAAIADSNAGPMLAHAWLGLALIELDAALAPAGQALAYPRPGTPAAARFQNCQRLLERALQADAQQLTVRMLRIFIATAAADGVDGMIDSLLADCKIAVARKVTAEPAEQPPLASPAFTAQAVFVWARYLKATRFSRRRQVHALTEIGRVAVMIAPDQLGVAQLRLLGANWRRVGDFWTLGSQIISSLRPGTLHGLLERLE